MDALSGRVESEVSRGEKLGAQNITLKDHLEKQRKVKFPHLKKLMFENKVLKII